MTTEFYYDFAWPDGSEGEWPDGSVMVWDVNDLQCALSVSLRNYNSLQCGLSVALRTFRDRKRAQSVAKRTNFVEELFDLYATEETLQIETFLGQTDGTLVDVALDDGIYQIEARPYKNQWSAVRCGKLLTVEISGGIIISVIGLPPIDGEFSNERTVFGTDIYWTWAEGFGITDPTKFGLWFGASSPVDTSGAPDIEVAARPAQSLTSYRRNQTLEEYVAIIAMDDLDNKGQQTDLLLPLPATIPTSPPYEWADREI